MHCLDKEYWEMDLYATLEEMKEEVQAHMAITEDLTHKSRGNNKAYLTAANGTDLLLSSFPKIETHLNLVVVCCDHVLVLVLLEIVSCRLTFRYCTSDNIVPPLRQRCFATMSVDSEMQGFYLLHTRPDTLHLFPHSAFLYGDRVVLFDRLIYRVMIYTVFLCLSLICLIFTCNIASGYWAKLEARMGVLVVSRF